MHIPDGYLSPSTCAALYAGAAPFWFVALRKLKGALHTRLVPRLSLMAAFAFVVMMFNIPLPGGSSGHAVGMALAVVVLGPSGAIIAISTALVIQAIFFGDGGITAIGANCFNMAVIGSLAAWAVYRLGAGRSSLRSARRLVAAGLAGYAAINAAALAAAIEFGIQPALFHDATGAPLYCPFPLSVAVPAMMVGHLAVAGFAELLLTAGVVAFLQRTDPTLLAAAAGTVPDEELSPTPAGQSLRPLWITLGILMVLTPLGLLAAGTAWGEWAASEFADPAAREAIAAASLHHAAPVAPPTGLERLGRVWSAPIPDYAPTFLKSPALGYLLSAMLGVGLVLLAVSGTTALVRRRARAAGEP